MNILCAAGIYPPEIGGPATFARMIKKMLPLRGHQVRVVTYTDTRVAEQGVTSIMRTLPKGLRHLAYFIAVVRHIWWADIIVVLDPTSAGLPAMWAARLFGKKFALRVGGDYAWEQGMQRYGVNVLLDDFLTKTWSPPVERLRRVQNFVASRARVVMVQSAYLASVVERWGVPKEKIKVVPNEVSLPALPDRAAARSALGYREGCVIISVGRLVPWKGFSTLIDAAKDLPIRLVIIGDGPDRATLEAKATGIQNIHFAGALSKEKLVEYLAAADICALNTGYEGFSHQLLEAMFAGLAVVTTDAGGNKELVRDGENALVVPFNDVRALRESLERLASDSLLRERLGKNAHISASLYTPDKALEKLESVLRSL